MADTGSTLANAAARRRSIVKARQELLDRPGIARRGGPPPPTAPAQDRTSPQEEALAPEGEEEVQGQPPVGPEVPVRTPTNAQPAAGEEQVFDEDTRAMLMEQIEPFLDRMRKQKLAKLHTKLGRSRKFYGGGI